MILLWKSSPDRPQVVHAARRGAPHSRCSPFSFALLPRVIGRVEVLFNANAEVHEVFDVFRWVPLEYDVAVLVGHVDLPLWAAVVHQLGMAILPRRVVV